MKVTVGVSARHIHLTKEMYMELFGTEEVHKRNDLNQPGEFAAEETVTIKTEKSEIKNVRFLGPFRSYNQVEISRTDAFKLGINPPVRKSGVLDNAETITVVGPVSAKEIPSSTIIAERHIHMTSKYALENGYIDGEELDAIIGGIKPGTIKVHVKTSEEAYMEIHIDTDDANAFLLKSNDEVEITKCLKLEK